MEVLIMAEEIINNGTEGTEGTAGSQQGENKTYTQEEVLKLILSILNSFNVWGGCFSIDST